MVFAWPTILGPTSTTPRLIAPRQEPEDNTGGVETRFQSPGARWSLDVTYPPMSYENARQLIGALIRSEGEEVTYVWPQQGLTIGAPGARAMGAAASSNARIIDVGGNAAPYTVRGGQFFNIVDADGRRYLHAATQTVSIPGSLRMGPASRLELPSGMVLDFANVLIQGLVQSSVEWNVNVAKHYGLSFTIKERK
jgi:hypothetical protein